MNKLSRVTYLERKKKSSNLLVRLASRFGSNLYSVEPSVTFTFLHDAILLPYFPLIFSLRCKKMSESKRKMKTIILLRSMTLS